MISLATSTITKEVRDNVNKALDDNRISGGDFIAQFEEAVAKYHGAKYGVSVCNGTMADIVALAALRALHPEKDEVIVPALTFIAQTNSVLVNGLKPIFVDVDSDCQINPELIKITEKTLAIMPANLLGKDANVDKLKEFGVPIIEDNCEAYGIRNEVEMSTYSFFPSHTITTGEGGMILTDDDKLYELLKACRNHGRLKTDILNMFHFPVFGLNGKMTNIEAAIGCAIAPSANEVIKKRHKNVELYNKILNKNWYAYSPHCYPVWYENEEKRNEKLLELDGNLVEARKLFSCIPTVEYKLGGDYPMAEMISRTGLFVPVHQDLTEEDIKTICKII
jgi:dTDP-4-amino-4,6-dideoxygalactose transaminase